MPASRRTARRDVRGAADAGRRVLDHSGPRLGKRDEFLDRVRRHRRVDDQHVAVRDVDLRDRCEVVHGVERQLLVVRRVCRLRAVGDQHRVTVLRRPRDQLGADGAARAGSVVEHERLAQCLHHPLRHGARGHLDGEPALNGMTTRIGFVG